MSWTLHEGDCAEVLTGLPTGSAHSLVTDPPAGISFMGKDWDHHKGGRDEWIVWLRDILVECKRVLKPGAHALVWALPRTSHWTATALEDAGFEIRDVVTHHQGSGFPKSLDVSKAIDKALGADREVVGVRKLTGYGRANVLHGTQRRLTTEFAETSDSPASNEALAMHGFGTALKPASEHWILARVPFRGTVAANVLEHGVGALNIDGCRIGSDAGWSYPNGAGGNGFHGGVGRDPDGTRTAACEANGGRWPANAIFSGDAVEELDRQSGYTVSSDAVRINDTAIRNGFAMNRGSVGGTVTGGHSDSGGASRFFYCPKPSRADRGTSNLHPTVKSTELMRWLVRLVTPPGGTVLDPFAGSGSTGVACVREGFDFIGIEREPEYARIARGRLGADVTDEDPATDSPQSSLFGRSQ